MKDITLGKDIGQSPLRYIDTSTVFELQNLVKYKEGKVASLSIVQNKELSITLMAIYRKEGLMTHSASGDAFVTILDGEALIKIEETDYNLKERESIIMPRNRPHSVHAINNMKMMLILIK